MLHLSLLSVFLFSSLTSPCSQRLEVISDDWSVDACIDDGPVLLIDELRALDEKCDGCVSAIDNFVWCLETDTMSICGDPFENTAHPLCSPSDDDPAPCDGLCCMMTILNEGCGGCLESPDDEDDE